MVEQDTRSRLVDAARGLFHTRGYENTSLAAVAERAEANPGSLYYFFKTKEALLVAVLERYRELLHPEVLAPAFERTDDPIERVFEVLAGYREMLRLTGCSGGCPIGNLAIEIAAPSPEVRAGIVANFDDWASALEGCLEHAGSRLPAELDRRRLARFVLTVMEGAVLQARGRGSIEPFDEAVAQLRELFADLEAGAKQGTRRVTPPTSARTSTRARTSGRRRRRTS